MDYSRFIILLARQRSGTHALRSAMASHPEISTIDYEVFNVRGHRADQADRREPNYWTFVKQEAAIDPERVLPDRHEELFKNYLEYLTRFSSKRFLIVDVKFMSTHFITQPHMPLRGAPYFFDLIVSIGARPLILTRKNYLRCHLSNVKAMESGRRTERASAKRLPEDMKVRLDLPYLMQELNQCQDEDALVEEFFRPSTGALIEDYANIFPTGNGVMADPFREKLCAWLGIADEFKTDNRYQKQSSLPLSETIENYDEVAAALQGTPFAYCLQDEPMYVSSAACAPVQA